MPIERPPLGRLLFLMHLVSAFFLAGYSVGFWSFVLASAPHTSSDDRDMTTELMHLSCAKWTLGPITENGYGADIRLPDLREE